MKKIFFIPFAIVCSVLWPGPVFAQIFIEEGKVVLPIKPGERVERPLLVHNTSDQTIHVRAYWEDFQYVAPFDAAKQFLTAGSSPYSFFSWVKSAPQSFSMPPFGKQKISIVFDVPAQIKGGHYGVLFLENESQEKVQEKGVNIVTRVGSLFFLEPENKVKTSRIGGMSIKDNKLAGKFINQGNVILIASPVFYMMDKEGVVVDRGDVRKIYLPPGAAGEFAITLKKDLPRGKYSTVMTFDLQDGDVIVKEVDFIKKSDADIKITATRD